MILAQHYYLARFFTIVVITISLLGCVIKPNPVISRFQGHWTIGEAYEIFTLLDGRKSYILHDDNIPETALHFLEEQPEHQDPFYDYGHCQSIYLDSLGWLEADKSNPSSGKLLHIISILKMEPAKQVFFTNTYPHPIPQLKFKNQISH